MRRGCNGEDDLLRPATSRIISGHNKEKSMAVSHSDILNLLREDTADSFVDALHEDIVLEIRFLPQGPIRLAGKSTVAGVIRGNLARYTRFRIGAHKVHPCASQNTVLVEATSVGTFRDTSAIYQNRYCFVIRYQDGKIIFWRTYLNPYPVIWAETLTSDSADNKLSRLPALPAISSPSALQTSAPSDTPNIATVKRALEIVNSQDFEAMPVLLDEGLVVDIPFQAFHTGPLQRGWAEFRKGLGFIPSIFDHFTISPLEIHECTETNAVFVDAVSSGAFVGNGGPYSNEYLLMFGFNGARIDLWREYYNPHRMNTQLIHLMG